MKKSIFLLPLFVILLSGFALATGDSCPEGYAYVILDGEATVTLGDDSFALAFTALNETDVLANSLATFTVNGETYEMHVGDEALLGDVEVELKDILPIEETVKIKVELSRECAGDDDDGSDDSSDDDHDDTQVSECFMEDASVFVGQDVTLALSDHEYTVNVVSINYENADEPKVLFVVDGTEKSVHVGELEDVTDELFIKVASISEAELEGVVTDKVNFVLKHCHYEEKVRECYDSDGGKNREKYGYVEYNGEKFKDECTGDRVVSEAYCHEGVSERIAIECNEGELCIDGRCKVTDGKQDDSGKDKDGDTIECTQGCFLEGSCVSIGYRHSEQYCDLSKAFVDQKASGACENNFECLSNVCADQQCIEQGFIRKLIAWLSRLFGG